MVDGSLTPKRLVRFCGADCGGYDTYHCFLAGDENALVNSENDYRCCWLPNSYEKGRDCPIRVCCEERGVLFCGECDELEGCERMEAFYSQPGYDEAKRRMFEEILRRRGSLGVVKEHHGLG
jgi:hypothetical protein